MRYGPPNVTAEDLRDRHPPLSPGCPSPPGAPSQRRESTPWPAGRCSAPRSTPTSPRQTGFFVNAYFVEIPTGIVVVDGTHGQRLSRGPGTSKRSASRCWRSRDPPLSRPLRGVSAVVAGDDVPIVSAASVDQIIRRDDAIKDQVIGGILGPEWPTQRVFPEYDSRGWRVGDVRRRRVHRPRHRGGRIRRGHLLDRLGPARRRLHWRPDLPIPRCVQRRWIQRSMASKIDQLESELGGATPSIPATVGDASGGPPLAAALPGAAARDRAPLANGQPTLTDAQKTEAKQRMDAFVPDQRLEFFVDISLDVVAAELAASG